MDEHQRYLTLLLKKLAQVEQRQNEVQNEIESLRHQITQLHLPTEPQSPPTEASATYQTDEAKPQHSPATPPQPVVPTTVEELRQQIFRPSSTPKPQVVDTPQTNDSRQSTEPNRPTTPRIPNQPNNLEKWVGENLISKIGIAITVIGVSLGIKYAIDRELISPILRIVMAYLFGGALVGVSAYLKRNYLAFSAVLLSGGMAILYVTTYIGYDLYKLFPWAFSFGAMLLLTVFTVLASVRYNQQVVAHFGLVGAYAVPLLLSRGSENVLGLFSYVSVLNAGILAVSVQRYWKSLYYSSFALTWLMYLAWYQDRFDAATDMPLAAGFASLFFVTFYACFLSYKLLRRERYNHFDILLLTANAFAFYAAGYALVEVGTSPLRWLGLFTLANAAIHLVVALVVRSAKLADRELLRLLLGMVLVFVTLSAPVQVDGNWVTLFWATEASLLFWIGRSRAIRFYEWLAYPMMLLAFVSLAHDWSAYTWQQAIIPVFNIQFLSSALVAGAFVLINYVHLRHPLAQQTAQSGATELFGFFVPAVLVLVLYIAFYLEIANYFDWQSEATRIELHDGDYTNIHRNPALGYLRQVWLIGYSVFFAAALAAVYRWRFATTTLGVVALIGTGVSMLMLHTDGLYTLGQLREAYLYPQAYFPPSPSWVGVRYLLLLASAAVWLMWHQMAKLPTDAIKRPMFYDLAIHLSILWWLSNEVVNWMQLHQAEHSFKLELSILWGSYAVMLVVLGIAQKRKHLRLAAIVLFGITLTKLFAYDMSQMGAVARTVAFVALGVLLLLISFLYNKFKHKLWDEN